MAESALLRVGGHEIKLTHTDRVVFPDDGVTKREIVEHYARVASVMVPYLKGRPVSMQRVRETIYTQVFYQKDAPDYFPDWIARVTVPKVGGTVTHMIVDDAASLVYAANQGCITPHVWLSRVPNLELPDRTSWPPARAATTLSCRSALRPISKRFAPSHLGWRWRWPNEHPIG